jgi:hypothetical protein
VSLLNMDSNPVFGNDSLLLVYHGIKPWNSQVGNVHVGLSRKSMKVASEDWKPLDLPSRMGVDMTYVVLTESNNSDITPSSVGNDRNRIMEILTTECDPEKENFGEPTMKMNTGVVLQDSAGRGLLQVHLEALESYIEQSLKAIKDARTTGGLEAARQEFAKMSPKASKMYFKA